MKTLILAIVGLLLLGVIVVVWSQSGPVEAKPSTHQSHKEAFINSCNEAGYPDSHCQFLAENLECPK